jgi:hypothetical protein
MTYFYPRKYYIIKLHRGNVTVYSHVIGGLQQAAMRRLNKMLQPELVKTQDVSKMFAIESRHTSLPKKLEATPS